MNGSKFLKADCLLWLYCCCCCCSYLVTTDAYTANYCATTWLAVGDGTTNDTIAISSPNYPFSSAGKQTCFYRFLYNASHAHRHTLCFIFRKLTLAVNDNIVFLVNDAEVITIQKRHGAVKRISSASTNNDVLVEQNDGSVWRNAPVCLTALKSNFDLTLRFTTYNMAPSGFKLQREKTGFFAKFTISEHHTSTPNRLAPSLCAIGVSTEVTNPTGNRGTDCVQQRCNAIDSSVFQCKDNKLCIDSRSRCNRIDDCEDSSDEQSCAWSLECSFADSELKNMNRNCASWSWQPFQSHDSYVGVSRDESHTTSSRSLTLRANTNESYAVVAFASPSYESSPQLICVKFWFLLAKPNQIDEDEGGIFIALVEQAKLSPESKRVLWMWSASQRTDEWQVAYVDVSLHSIQSLLLLFLNPRHQSNPIEFFFDDVSESYGKCNNQHQTTVDCTFEKSTCGWIESNSGWSKVSMRDERLSLGRLQNRDHTTGVLMAAETQTQYPAVSGYVMAFWSGNNTLNRSGPLRSVPISTDANRVKCLRFWVLCTAPGKRGRCVNLVVTQRLPEIRGASVNHVVTLPTTLDWHQVKIELPGQTSSYRLEIGIQMNETSHPFEVALDDVQLAHTGCQQTPTFNNTTVGERSASSCFRCPGAVQYCLLPNRFCDGVKDCSDGSDEYSCPATQSEKSSANVPKRDVVTYTVSLAIVVCGSVIVFVLVSVLWVRAKMRRQQRHRTDQAEVVSLHGFESRVSVRQIDYDPPPYESLIHDHDGTRVTRKHDTLAADTTLNSEDIALPSYETVVASRLC